MSQKLIKRCIAVLTILISVALAAPAAQAAGTDSYIWTNASVESTGGSSLALNKKTKFGPCSDGNYNNLTGHSTPIGNAAIRADGNCAYIAWSVDLSILQTNSVSYAFISTRSMNSLDATACVGTSLINQAASLISGNGIPASASEGYGKCGFEQGCVIGTPGDSLCAGLWGGQTAPVTYHVYKINTLLLEEAMQFTIDPREISRAQLAAGGLSRDTFGYDSVLGMSLASVVYDCVGCPQPYTPSVFAQLPSAVVSQEALVALAKTTAKVTVLGILMILPTSLLNSTLFSNQAAVVAWFRRRFGRNKARSEKSQSFGMSMLALSIASFIAGFADPNFGFNLQGLKTVGLALLGFAIVNFFVTRVSVGFFTRNKNFETPKLYIHWYYLPLIALTVLMSRFLSFAPPIVLGAVLAVHAAYIAKTVEVDGKNRPITEERLRGGLGSKEVFVTILIGMAAWAGYTYLVLQVKNVPSTLLSLAADVLSVITINALAALPVLLFPAAFLPGQTIWLWSKGVHLVWFSLGIGIFFYVLLPSKEVSLTQTSMTLPEWTTFLVGYSLFAVIVWAIFRIFHISRESKN
jgi:hypothetical protein